ncbi:hypothetical protein AAC978_07435 [Desulfitobacterium sp. THU1]|uniref:hypothetical protein n=1 Tax=Desulfitobacterium sp. THU1 TaxID=3138072 RepID=UPI00311F581D
MGPSNVNNVSNAPTAGNFLAQRPVPMGLQRFLAKKGINSPEELNERMQYAPRLPWRRPR